MPWLSITCFNHSQMGHVKRIWYLSPMWAAKVQASLRIRAVLPEPPLLAHTSSESRGTFSQRARSLASLNDWACAVKINHDRMLEDTNSLDGAQIMDISMQQAMQRSACVFLNDRDASLILYWLHLYVSSKEQEQSSIDSALCNVMIFSCFCNSVTEFVKTFWECPVSPISYLFPTMFKIEELE